ncbi:MAG TPA: hypothetical protein VK594_03330, partial [Streptosporangiaceae bacterium]|nr:hypothetical protein [Streptosporangiaceae bacterium]
STQAVAAAGQELRILGLGAGIPGAVTSDVARGSGDGTAIAAARAFACPARAGCATRDGAFA